MLSPGANLNRFFFFPQGRALTATLLTYALLFGVAAMGLYTTSFSDFIDKLTTSGGNTLEKCYLVAAAACGVLLATTYVGISPYYLSWRQALMAIPGSATVVLAVFFTGWGGLQLLHHQDFVLFAPEYWNAKMTLNNLAVAGFLALWSPIGLRSGIPLKGALPHDFSGVHQLANKFKRALRLGLKPSPVGGSGGTSSSAYELDWEKAAEVREWLEAMKPELTPKAANPMQPSAQEEVGPLEKDIDQFLANYGRKAAFNAKGYFLDEEDFRLLRGIASHI